jgi:hypothetical protein
MAKRLGYMFLLTALTGTVLVSACGDDDDGAMTGGEAGEPGVSGSPGDAGSGGSGVSGSSVGGQGATAGRDPVGGAGNAGESGGGAAGSGGLVGSSGEAGSGGEGQSGAPTGDGGAGGAPDPGLDYACGTTTIAHTYCSAAASLNCANTPGCPDCVAIVADERAALAECATCLALYDKGYQCGIDAFVSGNATSGLECVEGEGVYITEACAESQFSAFDCDDYFSLNDTCPATWPLE